MKTFTGFTQGSLGFLALSLLSGCGGSLIVGSSDAAGGSGGGGAGNGGGHNNAAGNAGAISGVATQADKLDVLFVVDNSTTMADKQGILEKSLPAFVSRLISPRCVDAQGNPVQAQPATGAEPCTSGSREFSPVTDMHLGVITTSIGAHGGEFCDGGTGSEQNPNDRAELLPALRKGLPSYKNSGFLAFDSTGASGVNDIDSIVSDLQTTVSAAGESGCGYEAPLEAMYRFLVDPEPPTAIGKIQFQSQPAAVNQTLLQQRAAFLRPDSAVAIVVLGDEDDCSVQDSGIGWFPMSAGRMPQATSACAVDPNNVCCRSCAALESQPPPGCSALKDDTACVFQENTQSAVPLDALHDAISLRCFNQKQRFGFDVLNSVERYRDALSNLQISNRAGELVYNPLFATPDGNVTRSASLINVAVIVGAPWQDLATPASLSASSLEYLNGAGLASNDRWPLLVGESERNVPPSDPFMIASIGPREVGLQNPLTHSPIVAPGSPNPQASPINGHEQLNPDLAELQYACTFALPEPRECSAGDGNCECAPDADGSLDRVIASNSPICQPPAGGIGGSTQYFARAYPGTRQLRFAQALGERALAGSICPKTLDEASNDYGYRPALQALVQRIGGTLK